MDETQEKDELVKKIKASKLGGTVSKSKEGHSQFTQLFNLQNDDIHIENEEQTRTYLSLLTKEQMTTVQEQLEAGFSFSAALRFAFGYNNLKLSGKTSGKSGIDAGIKEEKGRDQKTSDYTLVLIHTKFRACEIQSDITELDLMPKAKALDKEISTYIRKGQFEKGFAIFINGFSSEEHTGRIDEWLANAKGNGRLKAIENPEIAIKLIIDFDKSTSEAAKKSEKTYNITTKTIGDYHPDIDMEKPKTPENLEKYLNKTVKDFNHYYKEHHTIGIFAMTETAFYTTDEKKSNIYSDWFYRLERTKHLIDESIFLNSSDYTDALNEYAFLHKEILRTQEKIKTPAMREKTSEHQDDFDRLGKRMIDFIEKLAMMPRVLAHPDYPIKIEVAIPGKVNQELFLAGKFLAVNKIIGHDEHEWILEKIGKGSSQFYLRTKSGKYLSVLPDGCIGLVDGKKAVWEAGFTQFGGISGAFLRHVESESYLKIIDDSAKLTPARAPLKEITLVKFSDSAEHNFTQDLRQICLDRKKLIRTPKSCYQGFAERIPVQFTPDEQRLIRIAHDHTFPFFESTKGKELAFVVGRRGSGKSAFVNLMLGHTFTMKDKKLELVNQRKKHARMSDNQKGTEYPEAYFLGRGDKYIVDFPGFNDPNRSINTLTGATLALAHQMSKKINSIIMIIDANDLTINPLHDVRGQQINELLSSVSATVPEEIFSSSKVEALQRNFLFVFNLKGQKKFADGAEITQGEILSRLTKQQNYYKSRIEQVKAQFERGEIPELDEKTFDQYVKAEKLLQLISPENLVLWKEANDTDCQDGLWRLIRSQKAPLSKRYTNQVSQSVDVQELFRLFNKYVSSQYLDPLKTAIMDIKGKPSLLELRQELDQIDNQVFSLGDKTFDPSWFVITPLLYYYAINYKGSRFTHLGILKPEFVKDEITPISPKDIPVVTLKEKREDGVVVGVQDVPLASKEGKIIHALDPSGQIREFTGFEATYKGLGVHPIWLRYVFGYAYEDAIKVRFYTTGAIRNADRKKELSLAINAREKEEVKALTPEEQQARDHHIIQRLNKDREFYEKAYFQWLPIWRVIEDIRQASGSSVDSPLIEVKKFLDICDKYLNFSKEIPEKENFKETEEESEKTEEESEKTEEESEKTEKKSEAILPFSSSFPEDPFSGSGNYFGIVFILAAATLVYTLYTRKTDKLAQTSRMLSLAISTANQSIENLEIPFAGSTHRALANILQPQVPAMDERSRDIVRKIPRSLISVRSIEKSGASGRFFLSMKEDMLACGLRRVTYMLRK